MNNTFDPKNCRYSSQWRVDNDTRSGKFIIKLTGKKIGWSGTTFTNKFSQVKFFEADQAKRQLQKMPEWEQESEIRSVEAISELKPADKNGFQELDWK